MILQLAALWFALQSAEEPKARPCESSDEYEQFDFWMGEWDVFIQRNGKEVQAGENRIEKLTGGCLLLESWKSALGGTGKSVNYFDGVSKSWRQVWVDSSGANIVYEGAFRDGAMRFEGDRRHADGSVARSRMTFTPNPDGTVRQFIEQSKDGGKSWYVWFDGVYRRKR